MEIERLASLKRFFLLGLITLATFSFAGQANAVMVMQSAFTAASNSVGFSAIAYGQYLGNPVYIAAGNDYANPVLPTPYAVKSTDGITWTPINNLPASAPNLNQVNIANNVILIGGDNFAAASSDGGATWIDVTASIAQSPSEMVFGTGWDAANSQFIAFEGVFGLAPPFDLLNYQARTSSDGVNWSAPTVSNLPATVNVARDINDGTSLALLDTNPVDIPSPDNWGFVAVRDIYSGLSIDTMQLSAVPPTGLIIPSFAKPAIGHGGATPTMMVVGKDATGNGVASTSVDGGAVWSAPAATGTPALGSVVWNELEGGFMAEDINGALYSSPDGATWSSMYLSAASNYYVPSVNSAVSDGASLYLVAGNEIRTITQPIGVPSIGLSLNGWAFDSLVNKVLTLNAAATAGIATQADVYITLTLPNSSVLSLQSNGSLVPGTTPYVTNVTVPDYNGQLISHTFTGTEPPGSYVWTAYFTQPGTPTLIGTAVTQTFTFTP